MRNYQKQTNITHYIGILILGIIVGWLGLNFIQTGTHEKVIDIVRLKEAGSDSKSQDFSYKNTEYDFSLQYPKGLIIKEFDEGDGSTTIVFQKPDDILVGFQIYVTPYTESTITGDRILFDSTGVIEDLKEESLREDLLVATFRSEAPILGKTTEIWFIHGGYLFEITSTASLDTWLRDIIKTISFIS